ARRLMSLMQWLRHSSLGEPRHTLRRTAATPSPLYAAVEINRQCKASYKAKPFSSAHSQSITPTKLFSPSNNPLFSHRSPCTNVGVDIKFLDHFSISSIARLICERR